MLPCAILVGGTLSHDSQLSIFYALVQYARCRVFKCIEVKDGSLDTFRGWLVSEPVYWTELDCEATLVFGERPSAPILGKRWCCFLLGRSPSTLVIDLVEVLTIS